MEETKTNNDEALAIQFGEDFNKMEAEISKKVLGQQEVVRLLIISIFCNGHSLLVGVPGLAKTLLVRSISDCLSLKFKRIQFTPDLMPSDILGSEILDKEKNLHFIKGPVFSNLILADEINRTPPKTQAALLEAMQERSVTIAGHAHHLEQPFFVLATQNPIEQEGTYPLPEAQLDRFMFMIKLSYPSFEDEIKVIKQTTSGEELTLNHVMDGTQIMDYQKLVRKIPVPENVYEYVMQLVDKTRPSSNNAPKYTKDFLEWGVGTRAGQFLIQAARCQALLNDQWSPDIEHVRAVALPVLRHRIVKNFRAEAEGVTEEDIIKHLL